MKKIVTLLTGLVVYGLSSSCTVQKVSKITTAQLKPGISKEKVISLLGMPYKTAISKNGSTEEEIFYYKEQLWVAKTNRIIESILTFKGDTLESVKQGEEKNADGIVIGQIK